MLPLSLAPGRPSGGTLNADHLGTSRRLGGLRSAHVSPLSWPPGRPSGGTPNAAHLGTSRRPGGLRSAPLSPL
eukprot:2242165-Pyramimonas_sp.AAC.1